MVNKLYDITAEAEEIEETEEELELVVIDNEVVKRMSMFKEKSPDILKVIMES